MWILGFVWRWDGVWPGKFGSGLILIQFLSFIACGKGKSAFQCHHQQSVAEKHATQSQLRYNSTVIVFKAGPNKRHFSQRSDCLIMNGKLPSLLFIKRSVAADERLASKANKICRRGIKRERRCQDVQREEESQRWDDTGRERGVNGQASFCFLLTLSHSESPLYSHCQLGPCDHESFHTHTHTHSLLVLFVK